MRQVSVSNNIVFPLLYQRISGLEAERDLAFNECANTKSVWAGWMWLIIHCRWHNEQQGISGSDEVILCIQLCIALPITAFVTCNTTKIRIKDLVQMQVKYRQNESMVVIMSYACLYMWWCWVWFSPEEEPTAPTWHVRLEMSHPEMWGGRGSSGG